LAGAVSSLSRRRRALLFVEFRHAPFGIKKPDAAHGRHQVFQRLLSSLGLESLALKLLSLNPVISDLLEAKRPPFLLAKAPAVKREP
jgi:hypothetical protein